MFWQGAFKADVGRSFVAGTSRMHPSVSATPRTKHSVPCTVR